MTLLLRLVIARRSRSNPDKKLDCRAAFAGTAIHTIVQTTLNPLVTPEDEIEAAMTELFCYTQFINAIRAPAIFRGGLFVGLLVNNLVGQYVFHILFHGQERQNELLKMFTRNNKKLLNSMPRFF